jgi:hypothetical protein
VRVGIVSRLFAFAGFEIEDAGRIARARFFTLAMAFYMNRSRLDDLVRMTGGNLRFVP